MLAIYNLKNIVGISLLKHSQNKITNKSTRDLSPSLNK